MSAVDAGEHKHDIIIVRHGHEEHDDHHGGVWKIAFADFMTAMMCFFLVMWLINAANEQTKAAVASYFNPVKLIDRNASRKGLEDLGDGPHAAGLSADNPQDATDKAGHDGTGNPGSAPTKTAEESGAKTEMSDQNLFADPYAVLAEIATDTSVMQNVSQKGDGGAQNAGPATGASGGESYRDPFAPDFWSQQVASPGAEASAEREKIDGEPAKPGDKIAETAVPEVKAMPEPKPGASPLASPAKTEATAMEKPSAAPDTEEAKAKEPAKADAGKSAPTAAALKAAAEVRQQLAEAFKTGDKLHDGVSVEATDKGVVISITEVGGFADRQPKDAADPLAAVNRRIEILMDVDG